MSARRARPLPNGRARINGHASLPPGSAPEVYRPTRRPLIQAAVLIVPVAGVLLYFNITHPSADYLVFYVLLAVMVGMALMTYLLRPGVTVILDPAGVVGIQGRRQVAIPWSQVQSVREVPVAIARGAERRLVIEGRGERGRARITVHRTYIQNYERLKAALLQRVPRSCRIEVLPS